MLSGILWLFASDSTILLALRTPCEDLTGKGAWIFGLTLYSSTGFMLIMGEKWIR